MTEKRFFINGNMVIDGENIIPSTMWQFEEQQKKYCDELNNLHERMESKQRVINAYEQYINDLKEDGEIE